MKKKIFAIFLCVVILFTSRPFVPQTNAILGAGDIVTDFVVDFFTGLTSGTATATLGYTIGKDVASALAASSLAGYKIIALLVVQASVSAVIGEGDLLVRDYNNYLYISPQQRAMAQMNSFFNTVSRGRLSRLNYEGIGPNYDAYLVAQARQTIGGNNFTTNLQDQVSDPSQMFSAGNMKGIMAYMDCPNNPACYSLTAAAQYDKEFAKAQDIAKNEVVNGFLPQKVNGRITKPASLVQSALLQVDQVGTQLIMNADEKKGLNAGIMQIAEGMSISTVSRLANYGISDKAGQEAIRNKNDQFPFSLSYSSKGGLGVNAGGVQLNTGVAAIASQVQIGNTCISSYGDIAPAGATVSIQGVKYDCATKTKVSGTGPAVSGALPAITCTTPTQCSAINSNTTCVNNKCVWK